MEKSIEQDLFSCMQETFSLKEVDIREYSPLTLAYIGDSIYDLIIKTIVINEGNKQVQKLHKRDECSCAGICAVIYDACHAGTSDRRRTCCL